MQWLPSSSRDDSTLFWYFKLCLSSWPIPNMCCPKKHINNHHNPKLKKKRHKFNGAYLSNNNYIISLHYHITIIAINRYNLSISTNINHHPTRPWVSTSLVVGFWGGRHLLQLRHQRHGGGKHLAASRWGPNAITNDQFGLKWSILIHFYSFLSIFKTCFLMFCAVFLSTY